MIDTQGHSAGAHDLEHLHGFVRRLWHVPTLIGTPNVVEPPESYVNGIKLFNDARYWHAHEAWEEAWLAEPDPQLKLFYKGIIQTAAALVHWQKGNPRGLHLNWAKARSKLAQLPPTVLGLTLAPLIDDMDRFEAAEGEGLAVPQLVVEELEG